VREILRKIAVLNDGSTCRGHVTDILSAQDSIEGRAIDHTPDSKPVICQPLIEQNPGSKNRLERGIVEPVDLVEESRASVKILETRFVELFANERNLVARLDCR